MTKQAVWAGAALLSCALLLGCPDPSGAREICGNGIDDDGNGLADCADRDCAGKPECTVDAGYFGPCAKCAAVCSAQTQCVDQQFVLERPVPQCLSGRCTALNTPVQVNFVLDMTSYSGVPSNLVGSIDFRFVSKKALDGSAVSCSTVNTASAPTDGGTFVTDPLAIEHTGRFNVLGLDAYPLQKQTSVPVSFVNTGTGSDFLIWLEVWTGSRNSDTKLPEGRRVGTGCIETGSPVQPLTEADDCNPNRVGGSVGCRSINYEMPAPN